MAVTEAEFYDANLVAIVPMGFCFPGQDAKGGDLPPRRECARRWRNAVFEAIQPPQIMLLIGAYAQRWHLGREAGATLTETVKAWRTFAFANDGPRTFVLPHPSWRNNAWLKAHPWFEAELLPEMRTAIRMTLET